MARINVAAIKQIKGKFSANLNESLRKHAGAAGRSAGQVRLVYGLVFAVAAGEVWSQPESAKLILLVFGVIWLALWLLSILRRDEDQSAGKVVLATLIDVTIINVGLVVFWREGLLAKYGALLFLCYFPVLAVAANRYRVSLVLLAAGYAAIFYGMVATLAGLAPWLNLAMLLAGTVVFVSGALRPKALIGDITANIASKAIDEAGEAGARQTEIDLMAEAHQLFMPQPITELPGLWCAGKHGVGDVTSGDYYHVFETGRGPLVIVGDLGGEGFSALAEVAALHREASRLVMANGSPAAIAAGLNAWLLGKFKGQRPFTCVIAEWEGEQMRYVNAGHLPMIRMSKPAGAQAENQHSLPVTCGALGLVTEASITESVAPFPLRDLMILYTDGTFAKLAGEREKGINEIEAMAGRFSGGEVTTLCHRIFDCAQPGLDRNPDDCTVVVIRRQPEA